MSYATGALLGAALLALLPEAIEAAGTGGAHAIGLTLVLGLGVFFVHREARAVVARARDGGLRTHAHEHAHRQQPACA